MVQPPFSHKLQRFSLELLRIPVFHALQPTLGKVSPLITAWRSEQWARFDCSSLNDKWEVAGRGNSEKREKSCNLRKKENNKKSLNYSEQFNYLISYSINFYDDQTPRVFFSSKSILGNVIVPATSVSTDGYSMARYTGLKAGGYSLTVDNGNVPTASCVVEIGASFELI